MKDKKIIFILGHGRSGTTLLNKALSAHPEIFFINNEFNDLPFFYFNQKLYDKYQENKFSEMAKDFYNHPTIHANTVNINANSFRELINMIFDSYRKNNNKEYVGVKISNNIEQNVNMIKEEFLDAYCIHILRDTRDVCVSLRKTPFGAKSAFYASVSWKNAVNNIMCLKDYVKYYKEIRYEYLIKEPEKELKKLCVFLGINFLNKMLEFNKTVDDPKSYHKLLKRSFVRNNYDKWQKELTRKDLRLINAGAGKEMFELEYTNDYHKEEISLFTRLWEYIQDKFKHYNWIMIILPAKLRKIKYIIKIKLKKKLWR